MRRMLAMLTFERVYYGSEVWNALFLVNRNMALPHLLQES